MNRFAALDGLRGLCALGVAFFHLPVAIHLYGSPLVRQAYVFVDFFFVLSGFVIAHAYGQRLVTGEDVRGFVIRRVGRLWPLHLVTLAALVALEIVRLVLATQLGTDVRPPFTGETSLDALWLNALLLHGWGPNELSWNVPSWSISAELFAYLVFAAVTFLARSRAIIVSAAIAVLAWVISIRISPDTDLYSQLTALRAVTGFFAGVAIHALFSRTGLPAMSRTFATLLELGAAGLIVLYLLFISRAELTPWATPVFVLAIYVFAAERGALSALLKSAPLQVLGTLSFSIYLTHSLVITAFNAIAKGIGRVFDIDTMTPAVDLFPGAASTHDIDWNLVHFGSFWLNDLFAIAFAATVIALSAITYRFIEMPGQRLFAQLARPKASLRLRAS